MNFKLNTFKLSTYLLIWSQSEFQENSSSRSDFNPYVFCKAGGVIADTVNLVRPFHLRNHHEGFLKLDIDPVIHWSIEFNQYLNFRLAIQIGELLSHWQKNYFLNSFGNSKVI